MLGKRGVSTPHSATRSKDMIKTIHEFKLDFSHHCLFLDIDGTLIDIARSPQEVFIDPQLIQSLSALVNSMNGAVALVTGRETNFVTQSFTPPIRFYSTLHGNEIHADHSILSSATSSPEFEILKQQTAALLKKFPNTVFEDKGAAFGAHYRNAPQFKSYIHTLMRSAAAEAGENWCLQEGDMVCEIRPSKSNKGLALQKLMQLPQYQNRTPVTIGDDLTDMAMFTQAHHFGGVAIRVGQRLPVSCADYHAEDAQDIRNWLSTLTA